MGIHSRVLRTGESAQLVHRCGSGVALHRQNDGRVYDPTVGGRLLPQCVELGEEEAFLACFSTLFISVQ